MQDDDGDDFLTPLRGRNTQDGGFGDLWSVFGGFFVNVFCYFFLGGRGGKGKGGKGDRGKERNAQ